MLGGQLLLSGCMNLGPDFQRPSIDITVPQSFQNAEASSRPSDSIDDTWWEIFNDPDLDRTVEEALNRNLDIRKVAARILETQLRLTQRRSDRYPSLSLQGQGAKQRQSVGVPVLDSSGLTSKQQKMTTEYYSLSLPAVFELDFWGRLSRAEEAARADHQQAEEGGRVVIQSVIGETIALYLQIESLERRIQISHRSIDSFKQSLRFVEKRYERGLASILDLHQARRILAQAEAILPSLRQDLGITQQRMAVFLGRYPEISAPRSHQEDYYRPLDPVPPGLPSDLLLRRPDIRAAEAQLRALNARVGVAKANRFPRITLTGSFGYASGTLESLFNATSELWNLATGVTQPLFDGGKLRAGQEIAQAKYVQGVADYAKTVLTAFLEVERALLTRKEQLERRERIVHLLKESKATQQVAQSRYERGLVSYLTVLDAQQSRFRTEETLVLADLAIHGNRVSLHRALGGGWGKAALERGARWGEQNTNDK
jgi:multidrug efflux system outer membrane protein